MSEMKKPTREERLEARARTRKRMEREQASIEKRTAERNARPENELDLADKLDQLMKLRGLSQSNLARLTKNKIHQTRISRWLRRAGEPNLQQIEMLATVLRVPFDYFRPTRTAPPNLEELELEGQVNDLVRSVGPVVARDRILLRASAEVYSVRPVDTTRTYAAEQELREQIRIAEIKRKA
jgi:transcriptional regulator with XRE-family HTH domain